MDSSQTVARRYLEFFRDAGVPKIFGIPGVHNLPFWRDWAEGLPEIVVVRHEQTTVYAADGAARASGGVAVALTTTGPGAANAMGAFGEAAACGSPVILVASEIATRFHGAAGVKGVLHESRDQAGMFEPLAKAVFRPRTAEAAVQALEEAHATAMAWPRGPVYIDVPTDVLSHVAPVARPARPARPEPDADALRAAAAELERAEKVVVWCGAGVVQSGADAALLELAEVLCAPVVTTYGARGVVPPDHPSHLSLPPHEPEVAELVASADVLLAVGTDFDGMMTRNWTMPMPDRLVAVNVDEADLTRNYQPDVAVVGDARLTLEGLLPLVSKRDRADQGPAPVLAEAWRRLRADDRAAGALALVDVIDGVIDGTTKVICDMAVAGYWYGGYGRILAPRQLQYPVGWGTLGYALPAAVGPAAWGEPTLAIIGDGGVMFGLSELATIAQGRLPVTLLVVDDAAYGMLAYDQEVAGDARRGVDLNSPDWGSLGAAFAIPTRVVDATDDLAPALRTALDSRAPALVVLRAGFTPPRTTSARWSE